ncbi:glycosyltransferase family 2 protein [Acidisphaera sp. L21]|uniref:glycosyltransferase family 2 protein n=1 Tax=Acidisphaera sp. L21 TaxID=1641851 RepID=UPI00131AA811|nr:glycosyltransferase family 2 protein [Acidisphaera sp. L21]
MSITTDAPARRDDPSLAQPGSRVDRRAIPDISVVVATCNRPGTLLEAVQSALDQAGATVEVIVVDDSPGHTAAGAIDRLHDPRVRYVANRRPSDGRPAVARNMGVALARGALIHFLDDDDLVADGYYAACLAAFADRPDLGVVFGAIEPFGVDQAEIQHQREYFGHAAHRARRCARLGHRWAFTAAMLFGPTLLVCSAGLLRRSHVTALGGFDPGLPLVEDVDFYMRAIRHGGVQFLDRPALHYRIGPSLMRQPGREQMLLESYERLQGRYRAQRGAAEFMTLKLLAKGLGLA